MPTIVSLTAIPPRFAHLGPVFDALLAQTANIDEIRLYVPKRFRRFPEYDGQAPAVPKGIRVIQPDDDLGPASKVLFAVDEMRGTDCNIIYCDDDISYEPTRFARLIAEAKARPDQCIAADGDHVAGGGKRQMPRAVRAKKDLAYRGRRALQIGSELVTLTRRPRPQMPHMAVSGFVDVARGWGGVLVKPSFFTSDVFDIPQVVWTVDDHWLSGNMARNNVPIWSPAGIPKPQYAGGRDVHALVDATIEGHGRSSASAFCIKYMQDTYGIWL
ncbi:hypothetical protein SAMN04488005_0291 [Yoonia tamlensis]|uniref:Glycosyl transferase family 2 n=1 Tax=Yoonia tamlensis TaxID=390270 RepID=A0A1I6FQY9_9RHOB|nr:hypothetical protein [Yoonia tamlensis]SFR32336.1 hypothetical protein SAMN04488005_0291 [Yoonia tamlensis]